MKLVDLKVTEFISTLASEAPAPGGGSTAALAGALGIALTEMVCGLTRGRKKYAEFETTTEEVSKEATQLIKDLQISIDKDTEAYNAVDAVFAMPKETDEEKAARSSAMQEALKAATLVPMEVMHQCLNALKTTQKAVGKSNQNAASDLGVAALMLGAAVKAAGLNVLINVGSIKDEAFASKYTTEMNEIIETGDKLATEIYTAIVKSL